MVSIYYLLDANMLFAKEKRLKRYYKYNFFFLLIILFSFNYGFANNKVISLNLKWKHQFQFAGFYVAKQKGFYQDYGLDVKINEYSSTSIKDVIDNKIDFAVGDSSALYAAHAGKPVISLLAIFQKSPRAFISLKKNQIDTISKVQHKIIEMPSFNLKNADIYSTLKANNINFKIKKTTFDIEDLIAGKTDIISGYISNEPFLLEQRGYEVNILKINEYGFDMYGDILYTSKNLIQNNPEMVENFIKATIQGWKYAFENTHEVIELILDKYNTQNKSKEALLYEAKILKELAGDLNSFGFIDKNRVKEIVLGHSILFSQQETNISNALNSIYKKNEWLTVQSNQNLKLTPKEKEYLSKHSTLNLGYSLNFEPIFIKSSQNEYSGIVVDIYNLIAKKLGLKINYIIDEWEKIHQQTKKGKIDVVPMMNKITANNAGLLATNSIFDLRVLVYAKKQRHLNIKSIENLKNLKVAYNKKVIVLHNFLSQYKDTMHLVPSIEDDKIFSLLEEGAVDAAIALNTSQYILIKRALADIEPIYTLPKPIIGSVSGIRPDAPLLHSIISKAINSLTPQELQQISQKWLGSLIKIKSQYTLTKKEKEYLKNNIFTMCEQYDIYPLSGIQNGKVIGMRGAYIDEIVKKTGLQLKVLGSNSQKELLEKVKDKQCDMIGSLGSGQKIFPTVINTKMVMEFPYGMMGDIQSFNLGPYSDLSNYKFIVRFKNIKDRILSAYPNLNIEVINDVDKAISKVGGKTHFIALRPVTERIIQEYGFDKYKLNGVLDKVNQRSTMGVHEDHSMLLSIINKTIANTNPLLFNQIKDKYSIKEFTVVQSYQYLWYVVGAAVTIALLFYYRSVLLQKKNRLIQEKNEQIRQKDQLLFQQSKLAAMGEMIGAIAHQWRQPLNEIVIKIQKLEYSYNKGKLNEEYIHKYVNDGIKTVEFMSKTIDDFRNFFRVDKVKITFDLKKAIEDIVNIQKAQLKNHNINLTITGDTFEYYGLKNELQQVVLNIISNSKDALILNEIEKPEITIAIDKDKIIIEDNGGGIKEDIINRVFEPYFTTKDQGEGTGMGLYISKMIIEKNLKEKLFLHNIKNGLRVIIELKRGGYDET